MLIDPNTPVILDAELVLSIATIRLIRFKPCAPADHIIRRDRHLLDLCLMPRPLNMRGCYPECWGPHRFERLGDILFVPAGHALHVRADDATPQGSISCELHGDELTAWLGTRIDWTNQRLHASLGIASLTIRHLLRRLASEARSPGPGSRQLTEFLAGQLVIELGRYCELIGDRPVSGGLAAWRLRLIDERLRDVGEPPCLAQLADLCRISVRQLTRGFRASRGGSIGDYVAHNRIENAKRLLNDDHAIKAVAGALGFSSSASFAHAFQRTTGLTPQKFRQRVLKATPATGRHPTSVADESTQTIIPQR